MLGISVGGEMMGEVREDKEVGENRFFSRPLVPRTMPHLRRAASVRGSSKDFLLRVTGLQFIPSFLIQKATPLFLLPMLRNK